MWMTQSTIAKSEDQARNLFNRIADEDPDGHLGWEIDFPSSTDQFIPFLGTQIRISEGGGLESKYYRKEQKKQITLNFRSHHSMKTKVEVARNFYKTANISSSSPELTEESYKVVDTLQSGWHITRQQWIPWPETVLGVPCGGQWSKTFCWTTLSHSKTTLHVGGNFIKDHQIYPAEETTYHRCFLAGNQTQRSLLFI